MKTAIINFKVDPALKAAAQRRAKKLGISLSLVMSTQLRDFAAGGRVSLDFPAEPMTPRLEALITDVEQENERLGTVGPFDSAEAAIAYLRNLPPNED